MAFDLKKLVANIENDVKENENSEKGSSGTGHKILYPFHDGDLKLRLLFNPKSNTVLRKIVRHNKTACLQVYGEECPICKAISDVESALGKECGAFGKYGYKTRGICFAQVVDAPSEYLKGDGAISKGEIVIFMFPKTLHPLITDILHRYSDKLDSIVASNNSMPFVIARRTKKGGFPEYSVSLEPFESKAFEDGEIDGKSATGDEIFEHTLNELPNILDSIVPQYPDENTRTSVKALSETIKEEYLNSKVVNPHDGEREAPVNDNKGVSEAPSSIAGSVESPVANPGTGVSNVDKTPDVISAQTPTSTEAPNSNDGTPECFGSYCSERKCMLCLKEVECMTASKK